MRLRARSGPTLPPTPLIEWHLTQPLAPKTREPASGSWLGLNTGWAHAASSDPIKSNPATATATLTDRAIGDPFCRSPGGRRDELLPTAADATRITARSQDLLELSLSTPGVYACRTWALSNTATPKAYSFFRSLNCTSYSLPVASFRQNTLVRTPSL